MSEGDITRYAFPKPEPLRSEIEAFRDAVPGKDARIVTVRYGASIGARAVCVAPVVIGRWATVASGAVVTKDVPDHALVAGVPARRIGWVGRSGRPLVADGEDWVCPATGERYVSAGAGLALLEAQRNEGLQGER